MHSTEASETGLSHRKCEDLKGYVQGVNCVAVGDLIGSRPGWHDKGRDQQEKGAFHAGVTALLARWLVDHMRDDRTSLTSKGHESE